MQTSPEIILGIDPGTVLLGYGVIAIQAGRVSFVAMEAIGVPASDPYEKLEYIHSRVQELIARYRPGEFAIEAPFFGKNVQSMLKLGRAQGVAIAAAIQSKIPVTEYAPARIKQSITGNGRAGKEQVWKMIRQILSVEEEPRHFDASDALAVALCHHYRFRNTALKPGPKGNSWEAYLRANPGKLITP